MSTPIELDGFDRTEWGGRDPMEPHPEIHIRSLVDAIVDGFPPDLSRWTLKVEIARVNEQMDKDPGEPIWQVTTFFCVHNTVAGTVVRADKVAEDVKSNGYEKVGSAIAKVMRSQETALLASLARNN